MKVQKQAYVKKSNATRTIILEPYNREWPKHFLIEKKQIEASFKAFNKDSNNLVEIIHVGSTSVKGLLSKPIIDIIVVVKDVYASDAFLIEAGYQYKGEYNIPMRKLYGKKAKFETYVHLYEKDNDDITLNKAFCNYLTNNPQTAEAYAQLKKSIVHQDCSHTKLASTGITYYNLKKHDFIYSIIQKSGFNGISIRLCSTDDEWQAYHLLKQPHLQPPKTVMHSKDQLDDANEKNIVVYQGSKIVCAAQVNVHTPHAYLHFCKTDVSLQQEESKMIQSYVLRYIARWVKNTFNVSSLTT